jgi:hypothetical protein
MISNPKRTTLLSSIGWIDHDALWRFDVAPGTDRDYSVEHWSALFLASSPGLRTICCRYSFGPAVGGVRLPQLPGKPKPSISINFGEILSKIGIVEPESVYASVPNDMKAFCNNAWASACLYLPPQQTGLVSQPGYNGQLDIWDFDGLIDANTCGGEGGSWQDTACVFVYPASYQVNFKPAANFKLASSVQCDQSIWNYQIDVHGAISVQIKPQLVSNPDPDVSLTTFSSGLTPW